MLRHFVILVVGFSISLICLSAAAQGDFSGSVSGSGQVVLRAKATTLRVQFTIIAKGDDVQTIMARFEQKSGELRKALKKNGAKSVKLGELKLVGGLRAYGETLPYLPNRRLFQNQNPTRPPQYCPPPTPSLPGPQTFPPSEQQNSQQTTPQYQDTEEKLVQIFPRAPRITMQAQLTAYWPLQQESTPELFVEADRIVLLLHEKLKQFISAPSNIPPDLPKLAKIIPINKQQTDSKVNDLCEVSQPHYSFVGQLQSKQIRESMIKAYKKAHAQAKIVADISGYRIGSLRTISTSSSDIGNGNAFAAPTPYALPPTIYNSLVEDRIDLNNGDSVEVTAFEPSSLIYRIRVNAVFRLLEPLNPVKASD